MVKVLGHNETLKISTLSTLQRGEQFPITEDNSSKSLPSITTSTFKYVTSPTSQIENRNHENNANILRQKRSAKEMYLLSSTRYSDADNTFYDTRELPIMRHPYGSNNIRCMPDNQTTCTPDRIVFKAHGPQTGMCVESDR